MLINIAQKLATSNCVTNAVAPPTCAATNLSTGAESWSLSTWIDTNHPLQTQWRIATCKVPTGNCSITWRLAVGIGDINGPYTNAPNLVLSSLGCFTGNTVFVEIPDAQGTNCYGNYNFTLFVHTCSNCCSGNCATPFAGGPGTSTTNYSISTMEGGQLNIIDNLLPSNHVMCYDTNSNTFNKVNLSTNVRSNLSTNFSIVNACPTTPTQLFNVTAALYQTLNTNLFLGTYANLQTAAVTTFIPQGSPFNNLNTASNVVNLRYIWSNIDNSGCSTCPEGVFTQSYTYTMHGSTTLPTITQPCKASTVSNGLQNAYVTWTPSINYSHWSDYASSNVVALNGSGTIVLNNGVESATTTATESVFDNWSITGSGINTPSVLKPGTYKFRRVDSTSPCGDLIVSKSVIYDPPIHNIRIQWDTAAQTAALLVSNAEGVGGSLTTFGQSTQVRANISASLNTYKSLFPNISTWSDYRGFIVFPITAVSIIAKDNIIPNSAVTFSTSNVSTNSSISDFGLTSYPGNTKVALGNTLNVLTGTLTSNKALIYAIPKAVTTNWTGNLMNNFSPLPLTVISNYGNAGSCSTATLAGIGTNWVGSVNGTNNGLARLSLNHTL